MSIAVKICGIKEINSLNAAVQAGARYVGFVFFDKSPRHVAIPMAADLARLVPSGVRVVGLFVNPTDAYLDDVISQVPLDMIQLHGSETPERVAEIKHAWSIPVMKCFSIAEASDFDAIEPFLPIVDQILLDAKAPKESNIPGGNGVAFDWRLLAGRDIKTKWMLAGGLNPDNVAEAIKLTGTKQVDVSSGVEASVGIKDIQKIQSFIKQAQAAV